MPRRLPRHADLRRTVEAVNRDGSGRVALPSTASLADMIDSLNRFPPGVPGSWRALPLTTPLVDVVDAFNTAMTL